MTLPDNALAARIAQIAAAAKARIDDPVSSRRIIAVRRAEHRRRIAQLCEEGLSRRNAELRIERELHRGHDTSDSEVESPSPHVVRTRARYLRELLSTRELPQNSMDLDVFAVKRIEHWTDIAMELRGDSGLCEEFADSFRKIVMALSGKMSLYEVFQAMGTSWLYVAGILRDAAQLKLHQLCAAPLSEKQTFRMLAQLVRSGAVLLKVDQNGHTVAHIAAAAGNQSLLSVLVQTAPVLLIISAPDGATPLEYLATLGDGIKDSTKQAVLDAALNCLAAFPERTAEMLRRRPLTLEIWNKIASEGHYADLWSVCANGQSGKRHIQDAIEGAQVIEGESGALLRQSLRRVSVLQTLASGNAHVALDVEVDELRLRVAHVEASSKEAAEIASKRIANLEEQEQYLRRLCKQQEEELLALRAGRHGIAALPGTVSSDTLNVTTSANDSKVKNSVEKLAIPSDGHEQNIVEEIRQRRALGSDPSSLSPEVRASVIEMRNSLSAVVDTIARDLYESEAHFMQELLQNADDNNYAADVLPEVRFGLFSDCATTYFMAVNNEIGFSEKDVRSITDISRSSKSKADSNTTGYKGVGWKSVFRASDTPMLLSNGWRIRFNAKGLGCLTPEWISDSEYSDLPVAVRNAHNAGNTVFLLPLSDVTLTSCIEAEMWAMEHDPARLLFLKRVRVIRLCSSMGREVMLSTSGDSTKVSVVEPMASRENLKETQFELCTHELVTVALPLIDQPSAQRIFAFLPVRMVGFNFAVNAPFDLTTSRSDLHHTAQNASLRNLIAPAFLKACSRNESVSSQALQYLGSPPIEPFWFSVRDDILKGLQDIPCVPTEDGPTDPRSCIQRGESLVAKWIPSTLLLNACGLRFALASNPSEVLRELGVGVFGFDELFCCLRHVGAQQWLEQKWHEPDRSACLSDLYASLADMLREDFARIDRIQELCIFALGGEVMYGSVDCLYLRPCEDIPVIWQKPLLKFLCTELDLSAPAWMLFQMLGVKPTREEDLAHLALRKLLYSSESRTRSCSESWWAALAVLRHCFLSGHSLPCDWNELRSAILLPTTTGKWLPPENLRPWSFLGIRPRFPVAVVENVRALVGLSKVENNLSDDQERVVLPPLEPHGTEWDLGWEVFLCYIGCKPINPTIASAEMAIEATIELGSLFSTGQYWSRIAKSGPILSYLCQLLGSTAPQSQRRWLQKLPVQFNGRTLSIENLFVREVFHKLAGNHLPYITDASSDATVQFLLNCLGISVDISQKTLLKCLRHLQTCKVQDVDLGLVADIYAELADCGLETMGQEELIFVPGRGMLHAEDCVWHPFRDVMLQRCCRMEALHSHYSRYGERVCNSLKRWVRDSAENDVGELCDALIQVVFSAKATESKPYRLLGRPPVQPDEAIEGLFEAACVTMRALATLCLPSENLTSTEVDCNASIAFDQFTRKRLIVVPNGADACHVLHIGEAFWSVHAHLQRERIAELALVNHYRDNSIQRFLLDVLHVRPMLSPSNLQLLLRSLPHGSQFEHDFDENSRLMEGFDPSLLLGEDPIEAFDPDSAVQRAFEQIQLCEIPEEGLEDNIVGSSVPSVPREPRHWYRVAAVGSLPVFAPAVTTDVPLDFPFQLLVPVVRGLCPIFGISPAQVALAFDESGRCVSERRPLFLDFAKGRRMALKVQEGAMNMEALTSFWVSEMAHAMAHLSTGPLHDENFLQVQAEIVAHLMSPSLEAINWNSHGGYGDSWHTSGSW